ncbi:Fc.00g018510.m01.CDS01 [Cosmosporella sp. VM-42]
MTTTPNSKKAVYVDTIASLSDPLSSMSSIVSLVSLLSLAYQVRTPMPCVQERLLTLMQTMSPSATSIRENTSQELEGYSHEEVLNSFIQFLNPVLNGMAGMIDFLSAVDAFSRPEEFREFWSLEDSNLIKEFIEVGGPFRAMKGCDVPFLKAFVKDSSCRIGLGRDKAMLMLVPGDAQVGDDVWMEDSEHRLTVSRKGGNGLTNDGEAYLDNSSWKAVLEVSSTLPPLSPEGFVSD